MKKSAAEEKTENQRKVFAFFVEHFKSQDPFTKAELHAVVPDWTKDTINTYWSKQFKQLLNPAGHKSFRVSEGFRSFAKWESFQKLVTQNRQVSSDYSRLIHRSLSTFEFFMPLTNETHLRTALDSLFYEDTIMRRLKTISIDGLKSRFKAEPDEDDAAYFKRLCSWISKHFQGYSIATVSGRFRAQDLMSMADAVKIQEDGDRYLIDETTAIVRFIFPYGEPTKREVVWGPTSEVEIDDEAGETELEEETGQIDAKVIRWFFDVLFVQSIVQVVNGEAEIWMVESGLRNRLHIWRVESAGG
jgi:hypothetical protein